MLPTSSFNLTGDSLLTVVMLDKIDPRSDALGEAAEAYVYHAFRMDLSPFADPSLPHSLLDRYRLWKGQLNGEPVLLDVVAERLRAAYRL